MSAKKGIAASPASGCGKARQGRPERRFVTVRTELEQAPGFRMDRFLIRVAPASTPAGPQPNQQCSVEWIRSLLDAPAGAALEIPRMDDDEITRIRGLHGPGCTFGFADG